MTFIYVLFGLAVFTVAIFSTAIVVSFVIESKIKNQLRADMVRNGTAAYDDFWKN